VGFCFFSFNLIQVQGYSPTAAGTALVPFPVIMFLLSRWSGKLVDRYGARLPLMVGPVIAAAGFALLAVPGVGGSYWTTFFPAVLVLGLGMVISVPALTTTFMGAVRQSHAGVASGVNNAVSRTAGLLAITVLGIIILSAFNASLNERIVPLELSPEAQQFLDEQRTRLAAAEVPPGVSKEVSAALQEAIASSFVDGFRVVMFIAAGLAIASAIIASFMIRTRKSPSR
jgi:predicted MFS family arabinose efflux permease